MNRVETKHEDKYEKGKYVLVALFVRVYNANYFFEFIPSTMIKITRVKEEGETVAHTCQRMPTEKALQL